MSRFLRFAMILACVLAACCGTLRAQPTIPKTTINPKIPKKVRRWMERLYWRSEHDRVRACVKLAELKEEAYPAIPYLVSILGDSPKVRDAAATTLAFMGAPAVGPLMGALNNPDPTVCETAADTLLRMGPVAAPTIAQFLRAKDPKTRETAFDLLLRIGDAGVERMIPLLADDDEGVREYVALKLKVAGQFTEPVMTKALASKDASLRRGAVRGLARLGGADAVDSLCRAMGDRDAWIREQAALALGDIGDPRALRTLIAKTKDHNPVVRAAVATALGQLGDPSAASALKNLAEERDLRVRIAALGALGYMKDPSLVKPLGKLLSDPKTDRYVRGAAAQGIARLGGAEAMELLKEAVNDPDMAVRIKVIASLGEMGEAGGEVLSKLLDDPKVRGYVIAALGNTRHPSAMVPLEKLMETGGPQVRYVCLSVMGKLGDAGRNRLVEEFRKELTAPKRNDAMLTMLARALAESGRDAVPVLLEALKNPESPARNAAADAVRFHLDDPTAVKRLVEAMTEDDTFVNDALGAALTRITGIPRAARRDHWQAWWEKNQAAWPEK